MKSRIEGPVPVSPKRGRVFVALAALLTLWSPPELLADTTHEIDLWVEVLDAQGRPLESLGVEALEVLDDGIQVSAVDLTRAWRTPWPVEGPEPSLTLLFDRGLASSRVLRQAAESFSDLSGRLAELGEVRVMVAEDVLETTLAGREPLLLSERLSRAGLTETGERQILAVRRRVLQQIQPAGAGPGPEASEIAEIVALGIVEELELVEGRLRDLIAALAEIDPEVERGQVPRVLFWIVDGYDLDPVSFYTQHLEPAALGELLKRASSLPTLARATAEAGQSLASDGWIVLPVSFERAPGEDDVEYESLETESPEGSVTSAPGVTIRPGDLFGRRRGEADAEAIPEPSLVQGRAPLDRLAEASGGEVVTSAAGLRAAVDRLAGRYRLRFRAHAPVSGTPRTLEVRGRGGSERVRAPRWWSPVPGEAVARARLERLLLGVEGEGGLDVAAVLQVGSDTGDAELEARLSLRDLEGASAEDEWLDRGAANLRVTVAVATAEDRPSFTSRVFPAQDLRDELEWHYTSSLDLPTDATEVAVMVEALGSGQWGGRRATVIEGTTADLTEALPAPTVIEIEPPEEDLLRGRVKFETRVFDSRVVAVEFLLDDRPVARRERAPYAARINLGRTPHRQQLTVVALDRAGNEVGRDSAVLNGGAGGLAVEIVRPTTTAAVGSVEVEAEVEVPLERRLDRVLFFWNNEPVATLYGPPFRQRVIVPEDKPVGYVRVVAMLDDATMAEDVIFLNAPAIASERLDVQLVELYVVVTDKGGRPVRGLAVEDFRVREEGIGQEIATFSDASDLPLTLGMALDSSASMFVKLPRLQRAAIDFLRSTFNDQDRAFVVDFDSEPRLARSTTGDLDRIEQSILNLEASGRTALWESVVFSLVQLQGVRGRKALVVFSDGADEDDDFPYRTSLDIARRMGVPIYLILMKKEPKEGSGFSLLVRSLTSRVDRLVEATGGRVFYAKEYTSLDAVYDEIEYELRSQYLLGYYPVQPGRSATWRDVDVDVLPPGLEPRTLSGYWQ